MHVGFDDVSAYYVPLKDLQARVKDEGSEGENKRVDLYSHDWKVDTLDTNPNQQFQGLMVYNFDGTERPMPSGWVIPKAEPGTQQTTLEGAFQRQTRQKQKLEEDANNPKYNGRIPALQLEKYWRK